MSFTGKATFSAGSTLPEMAEDVSEVVGLVSPFETPFLDSLGDADTEAQSTLHAWIEDALNPNASAIDNGAGYDDDDTDIVVDAGSRFRVGDLIQPQGSDEVMQVTAIVSDTLTVTRGFGGSTAAAVVDDQVLNILGHTSLEGDDAPASVETSRSRITNYTQIFTESVKISGTLDAVSLIGVDREFDYQVVNRLRELLRSLERSVIAGVPPAANPQGSAAVRRSMRGLIPSITSGLTDAEGTALDEATLNMALRTVWENGGTPNVLLVNGYQKRKISQFIQPARRYDGEEQAFRNVVGMYESDFGVQRVILSRWVPPDTVLVLDTNRIKVLPLRGRSFHLKPLAESGDYRWGQVIGEYTVEVHNAGDGGHGRIKNLYFA
jgi:hypothetical protein